MSSSSWPAVLASVLLAVAVTRLAGEAFYKWAVARWTALNELEDLGKEREEGKKIKGTAVICGGSIGGLLAAKICSAHFEDVLVIDPDNDVLVERAQKSMPVEPYGEVDKGISQHPRPRIMQTRIIHASQVINFLALQRLWPDIKDWLKTAGAIIGPMDKLTYGDGKLIPSPKEFYNNTMPEGFSMTRSAYETLLRSLVLRIPNVRFTKGTVTGVKPEAQNRQRLKTVTFRGGHEGLAVTHQPAELVLDCSGTVHAGYTWLKRAGYELPVKDSYHPHMRYYTTEFSVDAEVVEKIIPGGFKGRPYLLTLGNLIDEEPRVIGITHVEHDRIHIMTGGWAFKGINATVGEIRGHVESLRQSAPPPQWLFDLLDYLETGPEETAVTTVAATSALFSIQYHNKEGLPSNFAVLGDASMKVNPVFGQGLTKAMIGAICLNHQLQYEGSDLSTSFANKYHNKLWNKLTNAWDMTKFVDYTLDTTEPAIGETRESGANLRWLFKRLDELEMAGNREVVWKKFRVIQWLAPPTVFLTPSILGSIAVHEIRKLLARTSRIAH